jgi:hypothetical protein
MKFYVGFDVKVNMYAKADRHFTNKLWAGKYSSDPHYQYKYRNIYYSSSSLIGMYWYIPATSNYKPLIFASCDNTIGIASTNLKVNDDFTYHYIVKNQGSLGLNSIVAVGVLPHYNDVTILENIARGTSNITLPCPNKNDIEYNVTDVFGNSAILENPVSAADFDVQFASVLSNTNLCLNADLLVHLLELRQFVLNKKHLVFLN